MHTPFLAILGQTELIIVLVLVMIFFGLGKLPKVGKQLGEGIRNFKDEMDKSGDKPAELPSDVSEQSSVPEEVTPIRAESRTEAPTEA